MNHDLIERYEAKIRQYEARLIPDSGEPRTAKRTYTLDDVLPGTMFEDETGIHWIQGSGNYVQVSSGMPTREDEQLPASLVVVMLNNARRVHVAEGKLDSEIGKVRESLALFIDANNRLTGEIETLKSSPCQLAEEVIFILKQTSSGEITLAKGLEAIEQRAKWHAGGIKEGQ